jgi:hypothetical protein
MDIEINRTSETLHKRHCTAPGLPNSITLPPPAPQRGEYRLNEYVKNVSKQSGVVCKAVAQFKRQRKHPLPDWNGWKHSIYKMRRRIGHPAAAA